MPHSHDLDTEVNAQYQMRDIVLWGCAAVFAATTAIATYLMQPEVDFPELASIPASTEDIASNSNTLSTADNDTNSASNTKMDTEVDTITTGSLPPPNIEKNTEKLSPSSVENGATSTFGTTVARRQKNADTVRRMRDGTEQATLGVEQTKTPSDILVSANTGNIGPGPIGIDLGTGHSFSILGKRFTAMVNAAPTLFAELSARASIVEHETSIEAHLVVGPLENVKAAELLCRKIQSRVNTPCTPANYTGRKLKLY
jgi:hypothetical protein